MVDALDGRVVVFSTLVVVVVWFVVSVECVLVSSVVVSDTAVVLLEYCVVVAWVVTSVEFGVPVDVTGIGVVVFEVVVSLDPCVVVAVS